MLPFGHGDGGGGPTREMMARITLASDLESVPRVAVGSPAEFFAEALAELPDPPRWVGELYFETHRGTFTSQARTKAGNRRCELLLREAGAAASPLAWCWARCCFTCLKASITTRSKCC